MTGIKHLLDELSEQAGYYDVTQRALGGGARRRRRRRMAVGGSAALAVSSVLIGLGMLPQRQALVVPLASPSAPAKAISCVVEELSRPDGYPRQSYVTGADPTGRYILGRLYPTSGDRLAIWDSSGVRTVAMPGSDDTFYDVTSSGVAVGSSYVGDNEVAWIYQDGRLSRLAGEKAKAVAINERKVIVGQANELPAVWRTPTSQPEALALPAGKWMLGEATGIGEDGYIVGSATKWKDPSDSSAGGRPVALLWRPDGSVQELPLPREYADPAPESFGVRSFQGDWAAGPLMAHDGRLFTIRWRPRDGVVEVLDDGALSWSVINRMGWLSGGPRPVLMAGDGRLTQLPTEIPGYQGVPRRDGTSAPAADISGISDDGRQVVGTLIQPEGVMSIAVRWICD